MGLSKSNVIEEIIEHLTEVFPDNEIQKTTVGVNLWNEDGPARGKLPEFVITIGTGKELLKAAERRKK